MEREAINPDGFAPPIARISWAIRAGGFVHVSALSGIDPATNRIVEGSFVTEARQSLQNLGRVLDAAGSGMDKLVHATVYVNDLIHLMDFNELWAAVVFDPPPARTIVAVHDIPQGARMTLDAVALA